MQHKRKIYISIISIAISFLLIYFLLKVSDLEHFSYQISNINFHSYFYAFLIYICINLIIAFRLYYFFSLKNYDEFKYSMDVGVVHAVALCVLPLRLGDLVYPFLVKKYLNKTLTSSFHNLIVLRIYDFTSTAILFFMLLVFFIFIPEINLYSYIFIILSITIAYLLLIYIKNIFVLIIKISEFLKLNSIKVKLNNFFVETEKSIDALSNVDHIFIFLFSVFRWVLSGIMLMFICDALYLDLNFINTLFLTTGMNMAFIIPLQTIGGIGLLESVLTILLGVLGQTTEMAAANAIAIRILWFVLPFLLGLIWISYRKVFLKTDHATYL